MQTDELHQRMETDYIDYRGAINPESESADADWSNEEQRSSDSPNF